MKTLIHFGIYALGTTIFLMTWYFLFHVAEKFITNYELLVVSTFTIALIFSWFIEGIISIRIDRKK